MSEPIISLRQLSRMMADRGVRRLYVKELSPNDNSKNQVYLGGDFSVLNQLPAGDPTAATTGSHAAPIFKADLQMAWLREDGTEHPAPTAQLILYPQYPEVRLSGILRGATWAPSDIMRSRHEGRVLIVGVRDNGSVLAFAAEAHMPVAQEIRTMPRGDQPGVLRELPVHPGTDSVTSEARLLAELCRIAGEGWITGWGLNRDGTRRVCAASNCVGVTLESELGITANGYAAPDFEGWEVKAYTVRNLARTAGGPITLMTPEPTGGLYVDQGAEAFVRRYGYTDRKGRADRMNYGGVHKVGTPAASTGLILQLDGYDTERGRITNANGALQLSAPDGQLAAEWSFAGMLSHWKRKHSRAVFVPALKRKEPDVAYRYSANVMLATGTDYLKWLNALANGTVYYDPGIKLEGAFSNAPTAKKRSQFRIKHAALYAMYDKLHTVNACNGIL